MNRQERRRAVRQAGGDWRREQAAKRRAGRLDEAALSMTPEQAREMLARWAARPGHSDAEIDRMNAIGGGDGL